MRKSFLLVPVGLIGILIALLAGGAGNSTQAGNPAVEDSSKIVTPTPKLVADDAPKSSHDPLRTIIDKPSAGHASDPDIVGMEKDMIKSRSPSTRPSTISGTTDELFVHILILDPNNGNKFVHCQKDVPLNEIKDLGNGRWSFPNSEGKEVVFSMPPIKSRPYRKGDEETYVEIWDIRPDGMYVTEPVVSERQVFFDPDSNGAYVCWMGSCLDTDGASKEDLFDYFENYCINPVPVKIETRVVRATPLN